MNTIRAFLFALLALAFAGVAHAATILPLAETTFLDQNGAPLAGGKVYFYIPNTLTPKSTFQNSSGSVSNTNPVTLDGSGRAIIYGAGQYRQQVYDVNGNLIWDQLTADTSGGATFSWAGTSAGTASSQTLSAPNFTLGDGQQIGFIAGFSNSGALTVVVNGGSPIGVIQASATGPQALGSVIAGNQYFLSYSATNGNFQIDTLPAQAILPSSPIVAAGTTDIGTLASHNANITGSTTITSFGSSASITSQFYFVTFAASPQITASSSILIPAGGNIEATPGSTAFLAYLGNGAWQIISYTAASASAIQPPNGRLTLTTATPVLSSPVTGATSVLYTPYQGNQIPIWNGAAWQSGAFSELTDALSEATHSPAAAVAASFYDLFVWTTPGGSPTQVLSRGPAWTNATTRALALSRVNGVLTNATSITNGPAAGFGVFVGTIATDPGAATVTFNPQPAAASAGPTGGAWLGLWNQYNRVALAVQAQDSKASWTYAANTWRQADASANNQITFISGNAEDSVIAQYMCETLQSAAGTNQPFIGIGLDSVTAVVIGGAGTQVNSSGAVTVSVQYAGAPVFGQHYFAAMEATDGSVTFYGVLNGGPSAGGGQSMQLSAQLKY